MSTVNGASCPNPNYQPPAPPPPPPPPPVETKPDPKAVSDPNIDPKQQQTETDPPPSDQVTPPPATVPVQQQTINVEAPAAAKIDTIAEAKSQAQTQLAQNLTGQIIAAAPPDVAATPEFRAGAQTLASQTSAQLTETISANFPQNAPPELLYQTITSVGGATTPQTAPVFAQMVQNVNQARVDSNNLLAQQGYDLQALSSNSTLPVARAVARAKHNVACESEHCFRRESESNHCRRFRQGRLRRRLSFAAHLWPRV